jgi:hypothetical protein
MMEKWYLLYLKPEGVLFKPPLSLLDQFQWLLKPLHLLPLLLLVLPLLLEDLYMDLELDIPMALSLCFY